MIRRRTPGTVGSDEDFLAVADTGALNQAARQLGLSPSAVSKHIGALESRLGAQLLTRTTRHVALTEVGSNYLENCRQILADLDEANSTAHNAAGSVQGLLRVEAPTGFAHRHVAPHLPAFIATYPHLSVEMAHNHPPVDLIESGFDISIRVSLQTDHNNLVYTEPAPNSRRLIATPAYLERHDIPKKNQPI